MRMSMPAPLVECVPNFSEGKNAATIEALRVALTSVPGVRLLESKPMRPTTAPSSRS